LTPVDAVSVNHAKVVPMSIATLKTSAKALESNAFLLFIFVIFNDLLIFPSVGNANTLRFTDRKTEVSG